MLSLGSSISWQEALHLVTGSASIKAEPLLTYYQPLAEYLKRASIDFGINLDW